jgi:hypothetical protein
LPLRRLLADPACNAVLRNHLGALLDHPELEMALGMKLVEIAAYIPDVLTPQVLQAIDGDLGECG